MADHGAVEYTTAEGNDLPEHEATYGHFVHLTLVFAAAIVGIVIGLAIGAVVHNWWIAVPLIFVVVPAIAIHGVVTEASTPSVVMVVLALFALAMSAGG